MAVVEIPVPDIGDFKNIPVIEVHAKPGDVIKAEDPIVTLESDKATMEVPAPRGGKVVEVLLKVGDKVSQGSIVARIEPAEVAAAGSAAAKPAAASEPAPAPAVAKAEPAKPATEVAKGINGLPAAAIAQGTLPIPGYTDFTQVHASPAVRRAARDLDVDLNKVRGTGEGGRITKEDVKKALAGSAGPSGGAGIPEIPPQDFSKWGPVEVKPMSRIQRLSGPHLHRAWLNVPHVTHTDEADITQLDARRKEFDNAAKAKGYRVTLLSFLLKACVAALKEFPALNSSLAPDKESLILKQYYNIGVAVDTKDGLVVPVLKGVDKKGIGELSLELSTVSQRMRDGKIMPTDIQGGTFSISSLGGIGGTAFTPIVNAPEVAILGVVRSKMAPHWNGTAFEPRQMLPVCLSYDHRVIDGALAARFTRFICQTLEDVPTLMLSGT